RKALCLSDGELAELGTAAGNCASPEWRSIYSEPNGVQLFHKRINVLPRHIHDQQILHACGAEMAVGKPLCEIGSMPHLIGADASSQDCGTHEKVSRLLLGVNADVITIQVVRGLLIRSGLQLKANAAFQFVLKCLGCPAMFQKQELQTRTLA